MLKMSQEVLQSTIRELDQAIYSHGRWYKELTRSIICRLSHDQRDMNNYSYRQCHFGQWYYNSILTDNLHNHPTFISIEKEHIQMHKLAIKLLTASSNNEPISPMDYDSFAGALDRLRLNINTLKHEIEETLYNHDPLTSVRNRVSMMSDLRQIHAMVKRNIQNATIVIMDIDHFKVVNDTYGHPVGDKVLKAVAEFVLEHTRPYDQVYRYGGEEFLLCMGDTDVETAKMIIDRLREELSHFTAVWEDTVSISVSASFGLSMLEADSTVEDAIEKADEALYVSKKSGRNTVHVWDHTIRKVRK